MGVFPESCLQAGNFDFQQNWSTHELNKNKETIEREKQNNSYVFAIEYGSQIVSECFPLGK